MKYIAYPLLILAFSSLKLTAQTGDCPYPILFLHGWNSNETAFEATFTNDAFRNIWGGIVDTFYAVLNANTASTNIWGPDNQAGTPDDDVLFNFQNESNELQPGCVYAVNYENFWNQDTANPQIHYHANVSENAAGCQQCDNQSNSNEASIMKQGYALGVAIQRVLAANPTKNKVVLIGHSMGGLEIREYLQRGKGLLHPWWQADGEHHVAKAVTVGTPHRGANGGNSLILASEANRDLRYSYGCGFGALSSCRSLFLYGGNEANIAGIYFNGDVDCNGVEVDSITGINQADSLEAWLGSRDNLAMPLPKDIRYTYCVFNLFNTFCDNVYPDAYYGCGGDGVVDDERQWIYTGGDGKTNSSLRGSSVPAPSDGVKWRLADRVTSQNRVFHTDQAADLDYLIRAFDEGDYPKFAHEIQPEIWFAGISQIRADRVPLGSEYTVSSNNKIDGDWFKVMVPDDHVSLQLIVETNAHLQSRIDLYPTQPQVLSNANAAVFRTRMADLPAVPQTLTLTNILSGTYYFRITHHVTATDSLTQWQSPYRFKVNLTPTVGIGDINEGKNALLALFPNPAEDMLQISLPAAFGLEPHLPVKVLDVLGRIVLQTEMDSTDNISVAVGHLAPGVYQVVVGQRGAAHFVKR